MLTILIYSILLPFYNLNPGPVEWEQNYEQAVAKADEEGKAVLMLFSGSDWCVNCKRLDKKILSQQAFLDYAAKDFILLQVDFPRKKKGIPVSQLKQNEALAQTYNPNGTFPKIVIIKAGEAIGTTEYNGEALPTFLQNLEKIRTQ